VHFHDLHEVREVELDEPNGWTVIPLTSTAPTDGAIATHNFVRAFMIQVAILANHQNGRDSHVRQIKIYGPRQSSTMGHFTSLEFNMYSCIR